MDTVITFLFQHHRDTLIQDSNTGSRTEKLQQNQTRVGSRHTVRPGCGKSSFKPCHTERKQCSQMKNCQPDSTLSWVCTPSTSLPQGLLLPKCSRGYRLSTIDIKHTQRLCQGDPWDQKTTHSLLPQIARGKTQCGFTASYRNNAKGRTEGNRQGRSMQQCPEGRGLITAPSSETWQIPSCRSNKA